MTVNEAGTKGGRALKGRVVGEQNANHRLTWDQVRAIRYHLGQGDSAYHLARVFKVSETTIRRIRDGELWPE